MSAQIQPTSRNDALFLADHPALDLLNTVARINGELVDFLQSDGDVLRWLAQAGWPVEGDAVASRESQRHGQGRSPLLQAARILRDTIRALVERRKAGKRTEPDALNAFLAESRSYLKLAAKKDGSIELFRKWKQRSAEEMLAPLAESAAELLANGDFNLIRGCEDADCVLWFYDRTKSHHRRWCSMANCGNRHKVAAYRKRQQDA
jgi:predicted RNA-binding Zn ribbon-like protein